MFYKYVEVLLSRHSTAIFFSIIPYTKDTIISAQPKHTKKIIFFKNYLEDTTLWLYLSMAATDFNLCSRK